MISVVVLTGNELRHRYFARSLSNHLQVKAAFFEKKANVHKKFELSDAERAVFDRHFQGRDASEASYFSQLPENKIETEYEINTGDINLPENVELVSSLDPEYILLFGSSLIKAPLLERFPERVINLHLGLSPYYRGSGTNFWPLVHEKPECVGATIHLATLKVDAGDILHQVRPSAEAGDTIHDLGNKTIRSATEAMPKVVEGYKAGSIKPMKQDLSGGFECKRKDLNAQDISLVYANFDQGMMQAFLADAAQRLSAFPIVDQINGK